LRSAISGKADGADYTFSGWRVTVVPNGGTFSTGTNSIDFNWQNFYFEIYFNYHIKSTGIKN